MCHFRDNFRCIGFDFITSPLHFRFSLRLIDALRFVLLMPLSDFLVG